MTMQHYERIRSQLTEVKAGKTSVKKDYIARDTL